VSEKGLIILTFKISKYSGNRRKVDKTYSPMPELVPVSMAALCASCSHGMVNSYYCRVDKVCKQKACGHYFGSTKHLKSKIWKIQNRRYDKVTKVIVVLYRKWPGSMRICKKDLPARMLLDTPCFIISIVDRTVIHLEF
jgi:hypothetical protein